MSENANMTGTILDVGNHGSLVEVVLLTDERIVHAYGEPRMTLDALEALFPEGIVRGESQVDFEMESWGGLMSLSEASS